MCFLQITQHYYWLIGFETSAPKDTEADAFGDEPVLYRTHSQGVSRIKLGAVTVHMSDECRAGFIVGKHEQTMGRK